MVLFTRLRDAVLRREPRKNPRAMEITQRRDAITVHLGEIIM